ncbi:hypothetical protein ACFP3I_04450 [Chryseobacterium arachidis]|uniref:hypothetical protein n=1 Tax=Chryseobacterium arachidis TaxID=1416778 RepID=UPI003622612A
MSCSFRKFKKYSSILLHKNRDCRFRKQQLQIFTGFKFLQYDPQRNRKFRLKYIAEELIITF